MISPNLPPPKQNVKVFVPDAPDPSDLVKAEKEDRDIAKLECPDCHGTGVCPACRGLVDTEHPCTRCDDQGHCDWCNGKGDNPDIRKCDYGNER